MPSLKSDDTETSLAKFSARQLKCQLIQTYDLY